MDVRITRDPLVSVGTGQSKAYAVQECAVQIEHNRIQADLPRCIDIHSLPGLTDDAWEIKDLLVAD